MPSINFDFDASELIQAMEKATKQYPASAEKVLKKEAKNIAKDLQGRVNSEAKGHHYAGQGATPKPLAKSFRQGKVMRSGSKVTVAVTTTAPHYHLYEEGHAMITHKSKGIRISKDAFAAGFKIKHIGEVLYTQVKNEFDAVVDKCEVTIYTDPAECTRIRHEVAIPIFEKRDDRLNTLTDESVDVYYSCILCQAFSPSHVCVVTPERLGLCGAVSWLDAKATNELDPNGPCQVITKERPIDENLGSYEDVDEAVKKLSQGALEHVTLYSIMQDPMTSCGCFECICGIEPFSNGVVIANREYAGMTPLGMTFSEMASMTGGGVQTPGFMGHGKHFISSKKFMKAEGGIERIVWMPKELKEFVAERLNNTAKELYGIENFTDMIGDSIGRLS